MKKIVCMTAVGMLASSVIGYSQGVVNFADLSTQGNVYVAPSGYLSSDTTSYTAASDFTVQLYAMSGNVSTLPGGLVDSYGYMNLANLGTSGLNLIATTAGGTANGQGADGLFDGGYVNISGTTGADDGNTVDVLALVAWTGTYADLQAAEAAGASVGGIAFVNPIGSGGSDPIVPGLSGWDALTPSPSANANGGYPDLVLSPVAVPEPSTLVMAGLGSLGMLMVLRRKKAVKA